MVDDEVMFVKGVICVDVDVYVDVAFAVAVVVDDDDDGCLGGQVY